MDPHPRPKPKRKVIAFPRQHSVTVEAEYRLADPVTAEVPRILDVPEELESTPFLDGLQLDLPDAAKFEASRDHIDLPCQPVRVSLRMFAGAVDMAVAGVGAGVFAAVAFKVLPELPPAKLLVLGLVVSTVVLWSAYQYLFVVYAGKTLGMMAASIRLRTFKGRSLTMRQRQLRVLSLILVVAIAGNGTDVGVCRRGRPLLARPPEPNLPHPSGLIAQRGSFATDKTGSTSVDFKSAPDSRGRHPKQLPPESRSQELQLDVYARQQFTKTGSPGLRRHHGDVDLHLVLASCRDRAVRSRVVRLLRGR